MRPTSDRVCVPLSRQTGQLNEYTDRKTMSSDVVCMALGSVPQGEQRSRFLAVGLADNTVRIISVDPSVSFRVDKLRWPELLGRGRC